MALNSLEMITANGTLQARLGRMINLKAQAHNQASFGVAIPLQKFTGALRDEVAFNIFKTKAEAAGFENKMLDRLVAYVEKMAFRM